MATSNASAATYSYLLKTGASAQPITLAVGQKTTVKSQLGVSFELVDTRSGKGPAVVKVKRVGNSLELKFDEEGTELVIEDFYPQTSKLVGLSNEGLLVDYLPIEGENLLGLVSEGAATEFGLAGLPLAAPLLTGLGSGLSAVGGLAVAVELLKDSEDLAALALAKIKAYAENSTNPAPTLQDYKDAGVKDVTADNLDAINSALNEPEIQGAQADTLVKIQAIVSAYNAILANANDATATDATLAQYTLIGVNGVDSAQEESLLGDVIDTKGGTDVDTVQKIQDLADAVSAVMAGTATEAQLEALGIDTALVTPENLSTIQAALVAASDSNELNTLDGLKTVIQAAVDAAAKIAAYAGDATKPVPVAADYDAIGVTGMGDGTPATASQPTVDMINSALADADITSAKADTTGEVQAIVDAYTAILQSADGTAANDAVDPTQAQYAAIGVNGVDSAQEESLLGDVIDTKGGTDVDTVQKIQDLADAVSAVMAGTATEAQLEALGIDPALVTPENLSTIQAALVAASDSNELNTLDGLKAVVQAAVDAAAKIAAYAGDATKPVPVAADYDAIGVTGMGDGTPATASQPTVAMINSALADADITSAKADTTGEVQAIVDAYTAILQSADGTAANDAVDPTQAQYAAIGVNGVDSAQEESLLGDVIDTKGGTDVDTVQKIQDLADAVSAVMAGTATEAQLEALGIDPALVTPENLSTIQAALVAASDSNELNTLDGLKAVIQAAVDAAAKIAAYAGDATKPVPVAADYDAIGVTGMGDGTPATASQPTVDMINSALADADITSAKADTTGEVQAIVDAYTAILQSADGTAANDAVDPTQAQYAAIGVNGVDSAQEESLLGDVIDTKGGTDVDTVQKIQDLADAVSAVMAGTATEAQLEALGIDPALVTPENLSTIQAALVAASDSNELNTLDGLKAVIQAAVDAAAKIAAYAGDATKPVPVAADYDAIGVTGMGDGTPATASQPTVAMINSALADADITSAKADTTGEVQAIVDAYTAILQSADGTAANDAVDPTQAQYAAIGVNGVDSAQEESLLGDVIDTKGGTDVDTVQKIQDLADAVSAVMAGTATEAQLEALGIDPALVTPENLSTIQAALVAASDSNELNTLDGLKAVIQAAVDAAAKIAAYAGDATKPVPVAADYDAIGVTGMGDGTPATASQPTVDMINSALADADITSAKADTTGEVQAIVDAYTAILAAADGTDANAPTPALEQSDYEAIGVNGLDAGVTAMLSDVIDGKDVDAVNTVQEIQDLANAAKAAITYTGEATQTAPTEAELNSLLAGQIAGTPAAPVPEVTADNAAAVQAAIAAANAAAPAIATQQELADVVAAAIAAYDAAAAKIAAYAEDNGAANDVTLVPALGDYSALGVTGVDADNLGAVNSALADLDIIGTEADSRSEVQAIVDAYTAILAAADGTDANAPTPALAQTDYEAIGVNGLDAGVTAMLSDVIDGKDVDAVNTVQEIQDLANAAKAAITYTGEATQTAPTEAELNSLLAGQIAGTPAAPVPEVTADNAAAVQAAIAAANAAAPAIATQQELADVVAAAIAAYDAAAAKIAAYAEDNGAANDVTLVPALGDYSALGVTGVDADNLGAVNSALADLDIIGTEADSRSEVQAIVDAYTAILAAADGTDANAPTPALAQTDYEAIGVNGLDAGVTAMLSDVIDGKDVDAVNTVQEIQDLANAAKAAITYTGEATQTAPTEAELNSLLAGQIAGTPAAPVPEVTADNAAAVQAAIAAANAAAPAIATQQELADVVAAAIAAYDAAALKIAAYAEDNGAVNPAPEASDYDALGVTGMGGSGEPDVDMINSALATAAIVGEEANTLSEVQAIVDAYTAILAAADGTDANAPTPALEQTDYEAIGVTDLDAGITAMLSDVIDGKDVGDVDTVQEIQDLANAAKAVLGYDDAAADAATAPTAEQINALIAGQTPTGESDPLGAAVVTDDALAAVLAAIEAANAGANPIASQQELADVVAAAMAAYALALDKIADFAETGAVAPLTSDYADAGVKGVTDANLDAINDAINSQAGADTLVGNVDDRDAANTTAEVQAIVDAYTAILAAADGDDTDNGAASVGQTDYEAIGVNGLDAGVTAMLSDVIDGKVVEDVNTVQEIQDLADAAKAVLGYDDAAADAAPTVEQINALIAGQTPTGETDPLGAAVVTDDALAAVLAAIEKANAASPAIATQQELADVVAAAMAAYEAAMAKIAAYVLKDSNPAPTEADYAAAGVTGVTPDNVAAFNTALNAQGGTDGVPGATTQDGADDATSVDTVAKLQAIVDAYQVIFDNADDATTDNALAADYETIGVTGVDTAAEESLLGEIIDTKASTDVNTVAKVQALASAVQDIMDVAALEPTDVLPTGTAGDEVLADMKAHLEAMGLTGVTDENIAAVWNTIRDTADDGSDVDTLQKLQDIINGANDAPTNTVPGAQDTVEDSSTALSITGLAIADADAAADSEVTVTLSVANGTLSVAADADVVMAANNSASVTLTGTVAAINSLLASNNAVAYSADADHFGTDTLTMTTNDGGNTGTGGAMQSVDTVTINITSVNDAPTGGVTITGVPAQGSTLTASTTVEGNVLADVDGLGTLSYQWYRDGVLIDGATSSTYVPTADDLDSTLTAEVSYTDGGGTDTTLESLATAPVFVDTTPPVFSGDAAVSVEENTSISTVVYDAQADDGAGNDSGVTYTLEGDDAGQFDISATGEVTFKVSPVFGSPTDVGLNNVYNITVKATDAVNNASTKDVAVTVTDVVSPGDEVVSLGAGYGQLSAPELVDGSFLYFWSVPTSNNGWDRGYDNYLLDLFNEDINGNIRPADQNGPNEIYRYTTLNGVRVALPTAGVQTDENGYVQATSDGALRNAGTAVSSGAEYNSKYSDLLAVWDAYNGTEIDTTNDGRSWNPTASVNAFSFWSATPTSADGVPTGMHAQVDFNTGNVVSMSDNIGLWVMVEVLSPQAGLQTPTIFLADGSRLINPVEVEGKWFYAWDKSGDGIIDGSGYSLDKFDMSEGGWPTGPGLNAIFTQDIFGNTNTAGADVNEVFRFATLQDANGNDVWMALPTYGGTVNASGYANFADWNNGQMSVGAPTAVDAYGTTNSLYDDFAAVNDAGGIPPLGWSNTYYKTASLYIVNGVVQTNFHLGYLNGQFYSIMDFNTNTGLLALEFVAPNLAPVLADTALSLGTASSSSLPVGAVGMLVSDLMGGVTDGDASNPKGMAIIDIKDGGTLWYSTNGGTTWLAAKDVTDQKALLLGADADNRIFFQPGKDMTGTVNDAITFRAWDRTSGSEGQFLGINTTVNGGAAAFSGQTDTVSITVGTSPLVLDLNGDGAVSYGQVAMDVNADGRLDQTAWAAQEDGVLVWDKLGNGAVTSANQYAFTQYGGKTDLAGLAAGFDSNGDGVFDAQDAKFGEFAVWQDADQDGVSDAGEVRSLADWDITGISLTSDGVQRSPTDGVSEAGHTTAQLADGTQMLVADAAFEYSTLAYRINAEGEVSLLGAEMNLQLSSLLNTHGNLGSVDLTGTGANTLNINLGDVLQMAGNEPLFVNGDGNDTVQVQAAGSFTAQVVEQSDVSYQAYDFDQNGQVDLMVQQQVNVVFHG